MIHLRKSRWSLEAGTGIEPYLSKQERQRVNDWLRAQGLDPDDVKSVQVRGRRIHVGAYKRNADGKMYVDPAHPAQAAQRHFTVPLRSAPPVLERP